MNYRVEFTPTATKDIRSLPKSIQKTVLRQIKTLEENVVPEGNRIKKMKGLPGVFYRLRIGDYRALFDVDGDSVTLHRIIHRKDLERVVSNLQ